MNMKHDLWGLKELNSIRQLGRPSNVKIHHSISQLKRGLGHNHCEGLSCRNLPPSLLGLFPFHVGYDNNKVLCLMCFADGQNLTSLVLLHHFQKELSNRFDLKIVRLHPNPWISFIFDQWITGWFRVLVGDYYSEHIPSVHDHQILRLSVDAAKTPMNKPSSLRTRPHTRVKAWWKKSTPPQKRTPISIHTFFFCPQGGENTSSFAMFLFLSPQ